MSKVGWAVGGSGVLTMGSVVPSPEDMVCVIPAQVILLGEALAPIAPGARQALTHTEPSSDQAFAPLGDTSRHLGVTQQALNRLKPRLDELMTDVIHKEGASAIDAGRAAGRLEQVISEFVDGYLDAEASPADGAADEARRLILGVYRHHITEICEWLEELVAIINHPATALHKRGMAAESSPQLTVALNLTTPSPDGETRSTGQQLEASSGNPQRLEGLQHRAVLHSPDGSADGLDVRCDLPPGRSTTEGTTADWGAPVTAWKYYEAEFISLTFKEF